jgi:hypothetical protein
MKAAQAREHNKARRRKRRTSRRGLAHQHIIQELKYKHLTAPSMFSVIDNPEETIGFLNEIENVSPKMNIDLDISGTKLTSDAIAALTATIGRPKFDDRNVRGNLPQDPVGQRTLIDSGFFQHVKTRVRLPAGPSNGAIAQRRSEKVEPATAAELIQRGTRFLFGKTAHSKASFRVMIEAMGNTHNHAAGSKNRKETWWGSVYVDAARGRICYTFVDTGIGIFRSLNIRGIKRFYNLIKGRTDADILRDMLEGKVESSTGIPYRGRGLPSFNTLWKRGDLKRLVIVTNDVYADVSSNKFSVLGQSFHGTLIYWEV